MSPSLTITDDGDRATVTIAGDVDAATCHRLRGHLHGLTETGVLFVLVDLTDVGDYNADLPQLLSRAQTRLRARGGLLATTGANSELDSNLWAAATLVEVFALYQRLFNRDKTAESVPA